MSTQPESKHTPGPWEAYYVSSAGWSVRMAKPRDGYDKPDPICSMAWWQFDKPGVIDDAISEANARLIAAAPELLEACCKLVAAMREYEWDVEGPKPPKYDRMMFLAEAAIAKASPDNQSNDIGSSD